MISATASYSPREGSYLSRNGETTPRVAPHCFERMVLRMKAA